MALFEQLQPASYKGAPFLVNKTVTSGGRKDVRHEFPNSNSQTIEDLGLSPRSYTVTAIINEPNYIQKRDRLLQALEEGGPGILVHPFYGRIDGMAARTFTLNEDVTNLGDLEVQIVFEPSMGTGLPRRISNSVTEVAQQRDSIFNGVIDDITNVFRVTNNFAGNFLAAQQKLSQVSRSVRDNVSLLSLDSDKINKFNGLISAYDQNINKFIGQPAQLGAAIGEIFKEIPNLYAAAGDQFGVLTQFFDFGEDDLAITETTAGLAERNKNNQIINESVVSMALAQANVSAAQIDFSTTNEIEIAESSLDSAFQRLRGSS